MEFPRKDIDELENNEKTIKLQITDWYIPEGDKSKPRKNYDEEQDLYTMLIYGTDENNITYSVNVIDYEPYFFVKAPETWDDYSDKKYESKVNELNFILLNEKYESQWNGKKYQKKIISNHFKQHFNNLSVVKKKEFWGFTNERIFNYIKVSVKSLALFNQLKYYFSSKKNDGFILYESNIDPFIRYIHELDIKPCGWISIEDYQVSDNETRCNHNITTNYKNVKSLDINRIAPLLIASFDIECTSSHGDFPLPKKDYKKVAQDLTNVARNGYEIDKSYLVYWLQCIIAKDVNIDDNLIINRIYLKKNIKFEDIPKMIEKEAENIIKLLNKVSEIDILDYDDDDDYDNDKNKLTVGEINKLEDDINKLLTSSLPPLFGDEIIQIGTTVHKYGCDDIIYKNIISLNTCDKIEDCDVIECKTEKEVIMEWKKMLAELNPDVLIGYNIFGFDMSYLWDRTIELGINDTFAMGLGRQITKKCILKEQTLSSSALGDNTLKYFDMDGIVIIDLLKVMQKDFKLDSYKLDNVASIYIGDKKDDLKPRELFEKYRGNSADRCVIAKYCVQDCALVNRLLHKLKILENNIGMGNVCLVPLNFLFRRGQGIKVFSLITKQCMDKGLVIPVINGYDNAYLDTDGYEGAVVLDPNEGMYLNDPIVVFDYGSLYPSSMIARDLSHDRYVLNDKYIIDDPNIEYIDVSYDLYEGKGDKKKKCGVKICKFAKIKDKDGKQKRGIIAEILIMLLNERKNTRKKIEYQTITTKDKSYYGYITEKENYYNILNIDTEETTIVNKNDVLDIKDTFSNFEKDVFDSLQSAYKITANSLYGQIGARTSPIYLKEIAACTTATGREMIMIAKDYVEKNYNAEVIYGDTDSIFCKFPLKDINGNQIYGKQALQSAIEIGQIVEKEIAKIMPYPQKLNYEKTLYPFIILSKKRYVGNLYEFDVNKFKQKSMGIVLKRRDNANIVKKIYGGIIDILLNKQDLHESIKFLNDELSDLVNGITSINDLIITKSLRGSYKDPTKIAHKVLADRIGSRDPGNKPMANDRVPYVYIKIDNVTKDTLQGNRIENPEYILQNKLIPDYLHYITNQIMKPVIQLYALCIDELPDYDKENDYWDLLDAELKNSKAIYQDDDKRFNRVENLKSRMVKELLFDKFINMLSEVKPKKEKKIKEIISISNDIINPSVNLNVTKKKDSKIINSIIKIMSDKKTIWKSEINQGNDKKQETINCIIKIIEYYKENDIKDEIKIKLNNKKFVNDFNIASINLNDFHKYEQIDENLIEKALNTCDIGIMSNSISILDFKNIFLSNKKITFI
jgi:DNA polymerase elongation subunit (family B)